MKKKPDIKFVDSLDLLDLYEDKLKYQYYDPHGEPESVHPYTLLELRQELEHRLGDRESLLDELAGGD